MREQSKHLSPEVLIDLVEEAYPSDRTPTASAHLAACSQCSTQFERLRRLVGSMRADKSEDAPPDLLAGVVKQFRVRRAGETSSSRLSLRRVIAALSFDSRGMNPALGVRAGEEVTAARAGSGRQMLYTAEDYDLDLRVMPSGEKWLLSGQLLGENCGDAQVELISGGTAETLSTRLNELCEFSMPPVEGGEYLLRLTATDLEIEVPSLNMGR